MIKSCLMVMMLLLAGCATKPAKNIDYYLLNSADSTINTALMATSSTTVAIDEISLASYLTQANLAMQLANHQLHYSKQHFWAEPLQNGIQKALLMDLNSASNDISFVALHSAMASKVEMTIGIQLDHFVATHDSMVVMSGYYWVSSKNDGKISQQPYPFYFTQPLQQDGYPHAVSQLRMLINKLSGDILPRLQPLEKL